MNSAYKHDIYGHVFCVACLLGRSQLWTDDMLWESCIRCSWTHPGKSIYWFRGERCTLHAIYNFCKPIVGTIASFFFLFLFKNPQNLNLFFTSHDYLPVPQFCFFMVSWSYPLVYDCEIPSCNTWSWNIAVWCVTSRLMCGVWECYCSLCSVDTCPSMTTTAWSCTGKLL